MSLGVAIARMNSAGTEVPGSIRPTHLPAGDKVFSGGHEAVGTPANGLQVAIPDIYLHDGMLASKSWATR